MLRTTAASSFSDPHGPSCMFGGVTLIGKWLALYCAVTVASHGPLLTSRSLRLIVAPSGTFPKRPSPSSTSICDEAGLCSGLPHLQSAGNYAFLRAGNPTRSYNILCGGCNSALPCIYRRSLHLLGAKTTATFLKLFMGIMGKSNLTLEHSAIARHGMDMTVPSSAVT